MALAKLPTELLQHIGEYLNNQDLSSFSLLNRQLHWRLFYPLFDQATTKYESSRHGGKCLVGLFFHAARHDSTNIAQYLTGSETRINLNEPIPDYYSGAASSGRKWLSRLAPNFTFLHFALLADAPRVAVNLIKNMTDINQEANEYPDLTPLYLALPRFLGSGQAKLDLALRIACSYALPRTAAFLLASGANANTSNSFGTAAIHAAVMRRQPWREFRLINNVLSHPYSRCELWESMTLQTVSALLDYGADVDLPSKASRFHECNSSCWRSVDCQHQAQTALHFASANGIPAVVSTLLDAGAGPNVPDAQGYTALYCAVVQGHQFVAECMIRDCGDSVNPLVNVNERTTALHVACRFSFTGMVYELLDCGADANVTDSHGRTPLHDVLMWACLEREKDVITTLEYLDEFHANSNIRTYRLTPRQIAEKNPSIRIRNMFVDPSERIRARRSRPAKSTRSKKKSPKNTDFSGAKRKVESPKPSGGPIPRQTDSHSVNSIWAPHKTKHLVKSFETSPKKLDSENIATIQEPFPGPAAARERTGTEPTASVEGVWSKTGTAQEVCGRKSRAHAIKSARHPQQHLEAFPVLRQPAESDTRDTSQRVGNDEASQFWGKLTKLTASAQPEMIVDGKDDRTVQDAKSGGKKRRWKPAQL
ncbi:MAG: hypothetical protein M1820_009490 [Bogoriella megaspora]|nr:MAG: hypothetical protein M1820_009490 [Bogoriella megaspora]